MKTEREVELERLLAEARDANRVLHRRIQHAEATRPAARSRGRARLAVDCVRSVRECADLRESLGKIRAIAAGWGHQIRAPEGLHRKALCDIEEEALKALAEKTGP